MMAPTDYRMLPIHLRAQIAAVHLTDAPQPVCEPKVLTAELQRKLEMLNSTVRWLRQHGHAPLEVALNGPRPTVLVDRTASPFLSRAGHGMTIKSDEKGTARIGYVLIAGCEIRWNEKVN